MTRMTNQMVRSTLVIAAVLCTAPLLFPGQARADPAGDPASCDKFSVGFAQRDSGAGVEWYLDHDCHFGQNFEIVVLTTEDGVVRDRHTWNASRLQGRTTRRVQLGQKPLCASSTVRVEASYKYMSVGDRVSSERVVHYDPNDNCDA